MELLQCSCGNQLREDTLATVIAYNNEVTCIWSIDNSIDFTSVPAYLVFSCYKCNFSKKILLEDLYRNKQKEVLTILIPERLALGMRSVRQQVIKEEHGIAYCGFCNGPLDGDGYCYNDIISNCVVRANFEN